MKIKILSAILLLAMLATLVACTEKPETPDESSEETETPAVAFDLSELEKYTIIRPEKVGSAFIKVIADLRAKIKAYTGIDVKVKSDFYREGFEGLSIGEYEILVGETNRPETEEFLSSIRYKDYGYGMYGKKLVISGQTEEDSVLAVRAFIKNIIGDTPITEGAFVPAEKSSHVVESRYSTSGDRIGLLSVRGLRVIYPEKAQNYEDELAEALALAISETYGYRVFAKSDKSELSEGGTYILIGDVKNRLGLAVPSGLAAEESCFVSNANALAVSGGASLGLYNGVNELKSRIIASKGENITLFEIERFTVKNDAVSSMSFNLWVSSKTAERTERVINMILKYLPDTFGVQEASSAWMTDLRNKLPMYACVGGGRDGGTSGEHSAVFYLKDKYSLKKTETKWLSETPNVPSKFSDSMYNRIYTYALLERKSDGKQFVHINTHFDHKGDVARGLQANVLVNAAKEFGNIPVIISGDFNAKPDSAPYTTMTLSFRDSAKVAESSKEGPTFKSDGSSNSVIDYLFVSPGNIKVLTYKVCNEKIDGDYASDHHPILISYVLG